MSYPMRDSEEGPVYDFTDTEQQAFMRDMDPVYDHVHTLAEGKPKCKVDIGCKFTGQRAYHWDSTTGVYWEALPGMGYDEWLIQRALMADTLVARKRRPEEIRQKA